MEEKLKEEFKRKYGDQAYSDMLDIILISFKIPTYKEWLDDRERIF
jgi:hypothetical protein